MVKIGNYTLSNKTILAPMAGVTDLPFRKLCRKLGAGLTVSEMVGSNSLLQGSSKTLRRATHTGESEPRSVQIAGAVPQVMAEAAKFNADRGAQIIDINMGCPAKKVCNTLSGSALLKDEKLVAEILEAVVNSVDIPVTLKIRTGWDKDSRNGVTIGKIAEECGIKALAVHGRTRCCFYKGDAEYDTIAKIKQSINIPVFANGDITSVEKAKYVLDYTKADAVMIGRAAQGQPWFFNQINHYLEHGEKLPDPNVFEVKEILLQHIANLFEFYGEEIGVRFARKHVGWYTKGQHGSASFRHIFNRIPTAIEQKHAAEDFFNNLITLQAANG